jgi:hypothetical protein
MVLQLDYRISDAKNALKTLLLCEMVMVCIYLISYLLGKPSYTLQALFDLDGEACIPAWFSAMQLFVVGVLLWGAARTCGRKSPSPVFLKLAGAGFIYISADEAAMIHERVGAFLKSLPHVPSIHGHGAWISLYLAGGIFFLMLTRRHFLSLWRDFRRELAIALAGMGVFLLGALGLEVFGDLMRSGILPHGTRAYVLEVALEEFFEMSGVSIILYGVIRFVLQLHRGQVPVALPSPLPMSAMPAVTSAATTIAETIDSSLLPKAGQLPHLDERPNSSLLSRIKRSGRGGN